MSHRGQGIQMSDSTPVKMADRKISAARLNRPGILFKYGRDASRRCKFSHKVIFIFVFAPVWLFVAWSGRQSAELTGGRGAEQTTDGLWQTFCSEFGFVDSVSSMFTGFSVFFCWLVSFVIWQWAGSQQQTSNTPDSRKKTILFSWTMWPGTLLHLFNHLSVRPKHV